MYTDQLIQDLIVCPKTIIEAPKDSGISRGSYKTVFGMSSPDGQHIFNGFISRNTFFQENFSIGLVYIPKEEKGKICLLRCNGLHGEIIAYRTIRSSIYIPLRLRILITAIKLKNIYKKQKNIRP